MLGLLILVGGVTTGLYIQMRLMVRWLTELREEKAVLQASLLEVQGYVTALTRHHTMADAEAYVAHVLVAARAAADALRLSAEHVLEDAREESKAILHAAHLKAQTLADRAYAAREQAEQLERAALARRRIVPPDNDTERGPSRKQPGAPDQETPDSGVAEENFRSDGLDATGVRICPRSEAVTVELKLGKTS